MSAESRRRWGMEMVYDTNRVYMIDAQVCLDPEIWSSHPSLCVSESNSIARDRTLLYQKFETGSCISSITIDAIKQNVKFDVTIWRPKDTDNNVYTLIDKAQLMTGDTGKQTLEFKSLCAK